MVEIGLFIRLAEWNISINLAAQTVLEPALFEIICIDLSYL